MMRLAVILSILPFICVNGFKIDTKIIGGNLTDPEAVSWFAHININDFNCGATLISDSWAITAAHCLRYNQAFLLRIGIQRNYEAFAEKYISKFNQYIHPKYANVSMTPYDIGLIKVPKINPNPLVQLMWLPTHCSEDFDDVDVVAVGNGHRSIYRRNLDRKIRQADFKTLPTTDCERQLRSRNLTVVPGSVLCAEPARYGETIFHGDSGGPLFRRADRDLIGIASYICGDENPNPRIQLQVWTKIQAHYDWISEVTGLDLPKC